VQYQRLIVSGELPCSKEEAATMAAIQLHVDEAWPDSSDDDDDDDAAFTTEPHHPGDQDHQILLLHHNGPCATASAAGKRRSRQAGTTASTTQAVRRQKRKMTSRRRHGQLAARWSPGGRCIDGENGVRSCFRLPDGAMARCLPPDYRSSRSVRQLIEVGKTP